MLPGLHCHILSCHHLIETLGIVGDTVSMQTVILRAAGLFSP